MVFLGLAVRHGSTAVDDWFLALSNSPIRWLRLFMGRHALTLILVGSVAVACSRRQWFLASAAVLAPIAGVAIVGVLKPLFGRDMEGALAYPSGHATVGAIALGMAVLVAGWARWALVLAVAWCLLGMVGVGATFHYFTDTVGGALLGTAIVCVAALALGHESHRT